MNIIYENFARELEDCTGTGNVPSHAGQDVRHVLELQRKRLQDKNLTIEYKIALQEQIADKSPIDKEWRDEPYISRMECRNCRLSKILHRNQKKVYTGKQDSVLYEVITDVQNQEAAADLFPKVTNFFFIKDSGKTKKKVKGSISKVIIPCVAIGIIGFTISYYHNPEVGNGQIIPSLIGGFFAGLLAGGLIGYFLWAMGTFWKMFINAAKSVPVLMNVTGSEKQFVLQMQKYNPEFSYEYFSGKVDTMLKMMIYSDHTQESPFYTGEPIGNLFSDIVESSYTGGMELKEFQIYGDYCYVTVDAHMENLYDGGTCIRRKKDVFRVYLCKNIKMPLHLHFSIEKMQGKKYGVENEDWIVQRIEKR